MVHRSKLLVAALTATALFGILVSNASASRLSSSNQNFRITWASLEFTDSFLGIAVRCPVTLEGSMHSATISKVIGSLIGYVTRASVRGGNAAGECTGGKSTVLTASLPWHVTYEGFTGTLPEIRSIRQLLRGSSFQLEIPFIGTCLSRAENLNGENIGTSEAGGLRVETLVPGRETIPCRNTSGTTISTGLFVGNGNVTLLGTTNRITIRLI